MASATEIGRASGKGPKRAIGLLLALVAAGLLIAGSGYWAVQWGPLRPAPTPQTIYVVYVQADPDDTQTPSSTETPPASESPSATASASATAGATARPAATPAPTKPDLTIGTYTEPALKCGVAFEMSVTVVNNSSIPTGGSTVVLLIDRYGDRQSLPMAVTVPALSGHGAFIAEWTLDIDSGCGVEHTLIVRLDPGGFIDESNEPNNVRTLPYTLFDGPDLMAHVITFTPANPVCGVAFTATVEVRNTGHLPAVASVVRFVDTSAGIDGLAYSVNVPAIPAGGSHIVGRSFTINWRCGEHHRMRAFIDFTNTNEELYEANNQAVGDYWL